MTVRVPRLQPTPLGMGLFERFRATHAARVTEAGPWSAALQAGVALAPDGPFAMVADGESLTARLEFAPSWHDSPPRVLWSYRFGSERALARFVGEEGLPLQAAYLGRLALSFGSDDLAGRAAAIDEESAEAAEAEAQRAAELERERLTVGCFVSERSGLFRLELRRASEERADWVIDFRGKAERKRLRDWLRWQGPRYLEFLEFAAEHGEPALERRLVDEMFETERRVKAAGRATAGLRPLRMWRGEE